MHLTIMRRKYLLTLSALLVGGAAALLRVRARQTREMLARYNAPGEKERRGDGPHPGDILLFYRPARKRDYIIQIFTDSPFYHAALYAGEGQVIEARPCGVARNDLRGREGNFVVAPAPEGKGSETLA